MPKFTDSHERDMKTFTKILARDMIVTEAEAELCNHIASKCIPHFINCQDAVIAGIFNNACTNLFDLGLHKWLNARHDFLGEHRIERSSSDLVRCCIACREDTCIVLKSTVHPVVSIGLGP